LNRSYDLPMPQFQKGGLESNRHVRFYISPSQTASCLRREAARVSNGLQVRAGRVTVSANSGESNYLFVTLSCQ